ncbi:MAG: flavodoxin family protein [Syntrophales bacterium]
MKITAIVGTYRKGGMIDQAVDEILAAAREEGAETVKIHLPDKNIEFCRNCRTCTQQEGPGRGECPLTDDMGALLDEIEGADAIVLASPMNFGTVTAVMKRFIERLVCFGYWKWGMMAPKVRNREKRKRAVVVATSAAPAIISRLFSKMIGLMENAAGLLGARTVGVLFIGMAAREQRQELGARTRHKASRLGKKLAAGNRM